MTGTNKAQAALTAPHPAVTLAAWLSVALLALCALAARAELVVDGDQVMVAQSDLARPARGMTMRAVEAKFGAPQERHAAVGQPPISRWDYQGFKVFFEADRVIDAVVDQAAAAPAAETPAS